MLLILTITTNWTAFIKLLFSSNDIVFALKASNWSIHNVQKVWDKWYSIYKFVILLIGSCSFFLIFTTLFDWQATKHASEGSTLALKPRGDITRSPKQGYQWPHEKDLCPTIFFLNPFWLAPQLFVGGKGPRVSQEPKELIDCMGA